MSKTDQLIEDLSDKPPRAKTRSPGVMLATWLGGMVAYLALLVLIFFKPRPDLIDRLTQPLFAFEIATLALAAIASARSAVLLSFPDHCQKAHLGRLPLACFALFTFSLLLEYSADQPPAPPPAHGLDCCMAITFAALPLAAWMFTRIKAMATVNGAWAGSTALIAAFSVSALGLRLSEPTDSMQHIITMHYLPMIGMALIGLWLGRKLLRW